MLGKIQARTSAIALLGGALLLAATGCATHRAGEDPSGGFTRVIVIGGPDSEGGAGVEHLFFRGADLGKTGFLSIAPFGQYAIFERNSDIFLIGSASSNLKRVTENKFSMPKQVHWNETGEFAEIEYVDAHPNSRIALK
jgi:hypothetical protein